MVIIKSEMILKDHLCLLVYPSYTTSQATLVSIYCIDTKLPLSLLCKDVFGVELATWNSKMKGHAYKTLQSFTENFPLASYHVAYVCPFIFLFHVATQLRSQLNTNNFFYIIMVMVTNYSIYITSFHIISFVIHCSYGYVMNVHACPIALHKTSCASYLCISITSYV